MRARVIALTVLMLIAVVGSQALTKPATKKNPPVIPPTANYNGASFAEWNVRWWQWCFGLPLQGHPLYDGPASAGQSGQVWFLGAIVWPSDQTPPPGPYKRTIKVPSGTALLFPILNGELNFAEVPSATSVEELRAMLDDFFGCLTEDNMYATVDGAAVENILAYRAITEEFTLDVPDGSILEDQGYVTGACEIYPVVGDGYYLIVPPMSVGTHKITFGAKVGTWTLDVEYTVNVLPAGKEK